MVALAATGRRTTVKNHCLQRTALAVGTAIALVGLAACDRGADTVAPKRTSATTTTTTTTASGTTASGDTRAPGLLIGTPPAAPTGDPPGTTPVASDTTTISKQSETATMPHEGDVHAYSSVAKDNPQNPSKVNPQETEERKAQ